MKKIVKPFLIKVNKIHLKFHSRLECDVYMPASSENGWNAVGRLEANHKPIVFKLDFVVSGKPPTTISRLLNARWTLCYAKIVLSYAVHSCGKITRKKHGAEPTVFSGLELVLVICLKY
jgi:hypothetical protein